QRLQLSDELLPALQRWRLKRAALAGARTSQYQSAESQMRREQHLLQATLGAALPVAGRGELLNCRMQPVEAESRAQREMYPRHVAGARSCLERQLGQVDRHRQGLERGEIFSQSFREALLEVSLALLQVAVAVDALEGCGD